MSVQRIREHAAQHGIVLVSTLLLLLVMTIMAISMFRSFGLQGKIAGNVREKQRAVQVAVDADQYAELWLTQNALSGSSINCTDLLNANIGQGQICSNKLSDVVGNANIPNVPWTLNGKAVGVTFMPSGINVTLTAGQNTYALSPRFYISELSQPSASNHIYQIDAVGYGANGDTVAVVESTFSVYQKSWSL